MIEQPDFLPSAFRRITLADRDLLLPFLLHSKESSCEFNFANLYVWGFPFQSAFQIYNDRLYLYFAAIDELLFTVNSAADNEPSALELSHVADAMRAAGKSGRFSQIRRETIDRNPDITRFFQVEPEPDSFVEYLYSTQKLAELRGHLLSKKRNLIAQFLRAHESVRVEPVSPDNLPDCLEIARRWRLDNPLALTPELQMEQLALDHLADDFDALGLRGLIAYADDIPVAFSLAGPVSGSLWTESFEKSLHSCKGAAQFINQKLAQMLLPLPCTILNREQDLGQEGLRQAKMSYQPDAMLRNFRLVPL